MEREWLDERRRLLDEAHLARTLIAKMARALGSIAERMPLTSQRVTCLNLVEKAKNFLEIPRKP